MPIPLIAVISVISAGGMMITSSAGYVVGTYLSNAASAATGVGYGGYRLYKLKKKISNTAEGKEARFRG